MLAGAEEPELAGAFIDFMLSADFQAQIPGTMFVYPALPGTPTPEWWRWAEVEVPRALRSMPAPRRSIAGSASGRRSCVGEGRAPPSSRARHGVRGSPPRPCWRPWWHGPSRPCCGGASLPDGAPSWEAILAVAGDRFYWERLAFTTAQAVASTALALAVGLPGAALFALVRFPGRRAGARPRHRPLRAPDARRGGRLPAARRPGGAGSPTCSPSPALPRLEPRGTLWAILAAHAFFNLAIVIRLVSGVWANLDPCPRGGGAAARGRPRRGGAPCHAPGARARRRGRGGSGLPLLLHLVRRRPRARGARARHARGHDLPPRRPPRGAPRGRHPLARPDRRDPRHARHSTRGCSGGSPRTGCSDPIGRVRSPPSRGARARWRARRGCCWRSSSERRSRRWPGGVAHRRPGRPLARALHGAPRGDEPRLLHRAGGRGALEPHLRGGGDRARRGPGRDGRDGGRADAGPTRRASRRRC